MTVLRTSAGLVLSRLAQGGLPGSLILGGPCSFGIRWERQLQGGFRAGPAFSRLHGRLPALVGRGCMALFAGFSCGGRRAVVAQGPPFFGASGTAPLEIHDVILCFSLSFTD